MKNTKIASKLIILLLLLISSYNANAQEHFSKSSISDNYQLYDSLVLDYIKNVENELINVHKRDKIIWLYDRVQKTDSTVFQHIQLRAPYDYSDSNSRTVVIGWLAIDTLTKKRYQWDGGLENMTEYLNFDQLNQLYQEAQFSKVGYVIAYSNSNYKETFNFANKISKKLKIKLDLRGYLEDKAKGGLLTNDKCGCGIEHEMDYYIRGRYDDGEYVSIEYSNQFDNIKLDKYFVVIASYRDKNDSLQTSLKKAKQYFKNSYIDYNSIYFGCMH